MIRVSVFYENNEDVRFDEDYFINSHIPMVAEKLNPLGLKDIVVEKGIAGGGPGQPALYQALAHMTFDSVETFQEAFGKEGEGILADVPNYTDLKPIVQISEIK